MHRRLFPYSLGLAIVALLAVSRPVCAQTNQGTDFWLAETANTLESGSQFVIAVANPNVATANVTIAHVGDPDLVDTVPAGGLKSFSFTRRGVCSEGGNNLGTSMVYHVTSDVDVVVYIFNPIATIFTNDASLVLPVPALGKIHRAGSYVNPLGNSRGEFVAVVGVQDGTAIQIFDRANVLVDSETIDQGEYYQFVNGQCFGNNDDPALDTTGWHVVTSLPAAVFSGSQCASAGTGTCCCDHLEEQVLPEEAVASTYVACPTLTRPVGCDPATAGACAPDIFRYVATVANTTVTTTPDVGSTVLTNPGDFLEISTAIPHVVAADQPVYGYQYLISESSGPPTAGTGDPSMLDMPPVDQLQFNYIFLTPSTYAFDFINVIAPVGTSLTLDGNPLAATCAQVGSIGGVDYCCLRAQVADGVHTINGTNRFGLSVSGFDVTASYAYIGGVGLQAINAGCNTGGPYQTTACSVPTGVQLDGTPSCSDQSPPTIEWSSASGATFDDATIADPVATVQQFGSSQICMKVTCPGVDPVTCCSTINVTQSDDCGPTTPTPTPTQTPTPTATGTPTAPVAALDHFQCYESHAKNRLIPGVSLVDALGPSTVDLLQPHRFCAPADKNTENPTAKNHLVHLEGYRLKQTSAKLPRGLRATVENQFGTVDLKLVRPDYLLIPSAKGIGGAPQPLGLPATVDHFKCYRVQGRHRESGLVVEDQFDRHTVDVKRPQRLCLAADKNGEGFVDSTAVLLCYEVRLASGSRFSAPGKIFVENQFDPNSYSLFRRTELCVPSRLQGAATPTPTPSATPTPADATPSATPTPADATPTATPTPTASATPADATPTPTATSTPDILG